MRRPEDLLVAHPFSKYTRRRRGHAGTRFGAVFSTGEAEPISCEVMLLNWADGPGGSTAKFLLDVELAEHPFMTCTRRTKDGQGTSFMGVLMELDDDDEVVNQAKRERYEKTRQTLSNVAAMMVKHPHFHAWLKETVHKACVWSPDHLAQLSNEWLKDKLGIKSKADLDGEQYKDAQQAFLKLRAAYTDWLEANNYDRE